MTTHPSKKLGRRARRARRRLDRRLRDYDQLMKDRYFNGQRDAYHRPGALKGEL
jgi:hypothetical protein